MDNDKKKPEDQILDSGRKWTKLKASEAKAVVESLRHVDAPWVDTVGKTDTDSGHSVKPSNAR